MSTAWWLTAIALVLAMPALIVGGSRLITKLTGRTGATRRPFTYLAIYLTLAFAIGIPPIYLMPDCDPLVKCAFSFAGIVIGTLAAEFCVGRLRA